MSELKTSIITNKEDLLQYSDSICDLFKECFSSQMSMSLWKWAYIDNPFGNPVVAMSFDQNRLVGHYAVIPNHLINGKDEVLKSALSMTTMVAESHRKHYLFTTLAEKCYAELQSQNYNIVCGFPNALSTPGFRKRLEWDIGEPDYVALVTKDQLRNSADLKRFLLSDNNYGYDVNSKEKVDWRLNKPDTNYRNSKNVITKIYSDNLDLMLSSEIAINNLDDNKQYNVLLDSSIADLLENKVFDYQFGYRCLNDTQGKLSFAKDMIISDVF